MLGSWVLFIQIFVLGLGIFSLPQSTFASNTPVGSKWITFVKPNASDPEDIHSEGTQILGVERMFDRKKRVLSVDTPNPKRVSAIPHKSDLGLTLASPMTSLVSTKLADMNILYLSLFQGIIMTDSRLLARGKALFDFLANGEYAEIRVDFDENDDEVRKVSFCDTRLGSCLEFEKFVDALEREQEVRLKQYSWTRVFTQIADQFRRPGLANQGGKSYRSLDSRSDLFLPYIGDSISIDEMSVQSED